MSFLSSKEKRVLLLFFIDGLGFDLAKEAAFMGDELRVSSPVKTILGYSVAAQPSILTGKYPQEHGGLCMFYRTSNSSIFWWIPWARRLERLIGRRIITRQRIESWTRKAYNITGYFSTYEIPLAMLPELQLFERKSFYLPKAIPGSTTLIDLMVAANIAYEAYYWNTPEHEVFESVTVSLEQKRSTCYLLYFSKLDAVLHVHGNRGQETYAKLHWYEKQIRRLLTVARDNYRQVDFVIFSDHGMMDVHEYWDLALELQPLEAKAGPSYRVMYDATMARFWFEGDTHLRALIMGYLQSTCKGRWLNKEELKELGAYFPDKRYGEAIFLTNGGIVIKPSYFGDFPVKGMHGYHPDEAGYLAFWGSNRTDLPNPENITDNFGILKELILGNAQG